MARQSQTRQTKRQARWGLLRLLLVLTLWQAPFPVLHSHSSFADRQQLLMHLQRFHAADGDVANFSQLGLHMHMMLPWGMGGQDSEDPGKPIQHSFQVFDRGVETSSQRVSADETARKATVLIAWTSEEAGFPALHIEPLDASRAFLDGFAAHLALPVRLGMMRC